MPQFLFTETRTLFNLAINKNPQKTPKPQTLTELQLHYFILFIFPLLASNEIYTHTKKKPH